MVEERKWQLPTMTPLIQALRKRQAATPKSSPSPPYHSTHNHTTNICKVDANSRNSKQKRSALCQNFIVRIRASVSGSTEERPDWLGQCSRGKIAQQRDSTRILTGPCASTSALHLSAKDSPLSRDRKHRSLFRFCCYPRLQLLLDNACHPDRFHPSHLSVTQFRRWRLKPHCQVPIDASNLATDPGASRKAPLEIWFPPGAAFRTVA